MGFRQQQAGDDDIQYDKKSEQSDHERTAIYPRGARVRGYIARQRIFTPNHPILVSIKPRGTNSFAAAESGVERIKKVNLPLRLAYAALVVAIVSIGAITSAHAVHYDWSFVGDSAAHSGTGFLTTDAATTTAGPAVNITGFFGLFGGNSITGLLAPDTYAQNDNTLLALSPTIELTLGGVSFIVGDLTYNIWSDGGLDRLYTLSDGVFTVSARLAEMPIPGALPLFATGLGALGLITYRRKRKQAA